jgi:hypothetical protein
MNNGKGVTKKILWFETIPRILLGAIFASAALSYFWREVFGWPLQLLLNPLPVPLATVVVVVICEVMLLRAYAIVYAVMFRSAS